MRAGRAVMALGGLVAITAASIASWLLVPGDPMRRAEAALAGGRWPEAVTQAEIRLGRHPSDVRARQIRARALAGAGRSAESRAEFLAIGADRLAVADYLALADLMRRDGRDALGWLALEAAGRIDSKNAEVRAAMADRRAVVGRQGRVTHVTDHLSAVQGGAALGELVVSLAAFAKGDSSDDPLVDRVLLRDRTLLRSLDSPGSVRRLIARILLEDGRPDEAIKLLADDSSPEASWLVSRAHLQLGSVEAASAAIAKAGDFGADRPHEPDPARYVGARACRKCHPKEYDAQQSSRHATTIHHGADLARIALPDGPVADPVDPKIVHTFTRENDKVRVETKVGDKTYRALMDYALGSGHHGVTLIGKDSEGTYREARISQYSEHGLVWDVTSGFSPEPSDPSEYLGKGLSAAGFRDCIHCHVTRFRSITDRSGPEALDRGIGCERCHGPGGNHVRAMEAGLGDLAIGHFKEATGPQRMTACNGCHQSDGTFPPTDPQFIRFQSTTLPFSKCYTESKGKLDCATCHNPHAKLETSAAHYEAKCLSCHTGGSDSKAEENDFRRVVCPVNATKDCLKCHMPREQDVVPHTSFTDHHIRVHREGKGR